MIRNRLEKNYKKLKSWAERHQIEAYRLYDRDIPEFPYIVDRYIDFFVVYDKSNDWIDQKKNHRPELLEALQSLFQCSADHIIVKDRDRQKGQLQYEKLSERNERLVVRESQAQFYVNLYDYLDTGLFLDHRPMRQKIFKEAQGKRFLNLFSYTGAVSVFAALGGAQTTSVDMSATYTTWAQDNFKLNQIELGNHQFIQMNALEYLESFSEKEKFDLIFLDPPTFSNSKRMDRAFEVEQDQDFLVESCVKMLNPQGRLYFSNNKRKFKLSEKVYSTHKVADITKATIPIDFHDQKIHHCFVIEPHK